MNTVHGFMYKFSLGEYGPETLVQGQGKGRANCGFSTEQNEFQGGLYGKKQDFDVKKLH